MATKKKFTPKSKQTFLIVWELLGIVYREQYKHDDMKSMLACFVDECIIYSITKID